MWREYRTIVWQLTTIFIILLWPFIDHPVVFGVTFFKVFHDCQDERIIKFIRECYYNGIEIKFVDVEEWLK